MRLFISIGLCVEMKEAIKAVQDQFRRFRVSGNYTSQENLHITLAFIGEYDDPGRVLDTMENVSFYPFKLKMDRAGCFGDLWWTGFEENRALEAVVRQVRRALSDAGIPFDRKKFKAHVTILRKPQYYADYIPQVSVESSEMYVDTISLMQSVRGKSGMIYTELGSVKAKTSQQDQM